MNQYYICHQKDHIVQEEECTYIPYGDRSLYDGICHPYPLKLEGLVEKGQVFEVEETTRVICTATDHIRSRYRCTNVHFPASGAHERLDGRSGHKWSPYYISDTEVLVKAKVTHTSHLGVRVAIPLDYIPYIPHDEIVGVVPYKTPDEPDRKVLLTDKKGNVYSYKDIAESPGWTRLDWAGALKWGRLHAEYGPFSIFKPDGEI